MDDEEKTYSRSMTKFFLDYIFLGGKYPFYGRKCSFFGGKHPFLEENLLA